jgi:hypothetical protein
MVHGQGVVLQRRRKVVWRIAFFVLIIKSFVIKFLILRGKNNVQFEDD